MCPLEESDDEYEIDDEDDNDDEDNNDDDEGNIEFALRRLSRLKSTQVPCNYTQYKKNYFNKYTVDGKRILSKMPLKVFHERLIHHFDIRFKKNDIQWPQRGK